MVCKIDFTNWNAKITLLRAPMVATYRIKLFRTGADRHNGILMSLLLLVEERQKKWLRRETRKVVPSRVSTELMENENL